MIGSTISHYEITGELAAAPHSTVYEARERVLGEKVAIRIFDRSIGSDDMATQRFIREAKAAAALNHRHVASILEIGRGPSGSALVDNRLFVVTPLGDAPRPGSLSRFASRDPENAVDLARQFLEALSSAHELGLVHGALTPDNIAVSDSGKVVVGDFGLGRLSKEGEPIEEQAPYQAPERRSGRDPSVASDLYSAGAILYELIAGKPPEKRADGNPPLLEGVSPELTDVVFHMLAPRPEDRPQTARSILDALQDVPEAANADARSIFVVPQSRSWSRMLVAVGVIVASAAAIWMAIRPSGISADQRVLAIAPFKVEADSSLQFLSDGVPDALAIAFDSVDGWRTVGADAVIGWVSRSVYGAESQLAQEIADRFEAGRVVTGFVEQSADRTTINASIYAGGAMMARDLVVSFASPDSFARGLDLLSNLIAEELEIDARPSVSGRTTRSSVALRQFLEGTDAVRDGSPALAAIDFEEAVSEDPDFGLAWSELARAAQLQGDHDQVDTSLTRALERIDRLPPRNRTLTQARDLAFRAGRPEDARRLYARVLESDSTNVAALSEMAETIVRYNPSRGLDTRDAWTYLERAIAFSPDQTPIMDRLYGVAIDDDRRAEADSILTIIAQHDDGRPLASFVRLATGLEDIDAAEVLLLEASESGRLDPFIDGTTEFLRSLLAAAEGRFADHERLTWEAGTNYAGTRLVSEVMLRAHRGYPASPDKLHELAARIAQWDTVANPVRMLDSTDVLAGQYLPVRAFLEAVIALRQNDDKTVVRAMEVLDSQASADADGLAASLGATARAIAANRTGDYAVALAQTDQSSLTVPWSKMSKSELYDQSLNRYLRSEILFELGRFEESLRYSLSLTNSGDIWGLTYLGPLYLRRAQTYTQMGRTEKAIDQYRRLLDLWDECDEVLVETRESARAEMLRLIGQIQN